MSPTRPSRGTPKMGFPEQVDKKGLDRGRSATVSGKDGLELPGRPARRTSGRKGG